MTLLCDYDVIESEFENDFWQKLHDCRITKNQTTIKLKILLPKLLKICKPTHNENIDFGFIVIN